MMMYRIFQIVIVLFMQVYLVYNHLVCPKTDVVDDFDSEKIKGIWYVISKFPNPFDSGYKCQTLNFETLSADQFRVNSTGLGMYYNDPVSFQVYFNYLESHNVANFSFTFVGKSSSLNGNVTSLIRFIAVVPDSYLIFYSCEEPNEEYGWIASRSLPDNVNKFMKGINYIMEDNGINWTEDELVEQDDCEGLPNYRKK